jgi:hypothetical protein
LSEPFGNKSGLMSFYITLEVSLGLKDPFTTNSCSPMR